MGKCKTNNSGADDENWLAVVRHCTGSAGLQARVCFFGDYDKSSEKTQVRGYGYNVWSDSFAELLGEVFEKLISLR